MILQEKNHIDLKNILFHIVFYLCLLIFKVSLCE